MKRLLAFDLDGTLAESKSSLTPGIAKLLHELGEHFQLAIVSGGDFLQYQQLVLPHLDPVSLHPKLYLLPASGGKIYQYKNDEWLQVFGIVLTPEEKEQILRVIDASNVLNLHALEDTYGDIIEDRDSQFTLSMLGQQAPWEIKREWDPDKTKRKQIVDLLSPLLPDFDVRYGGSTSVEIAKKGIDKAFGIQKLSELGGFNHDEILFYGDSLEEEGNDFPVKQLGIDTIAVKNPDETLLHLSNLLKELR